MAPTLTAHFPFTSWKTSKRLISKQDNFQHTHLSMDHIPLVSDGNYTFKLPEVPYISYHSNDGGDFAGYPARSGFDKQRLLQGDYSEHTPSHCASFLQSWLFFGLLQEFTGITIDHQRFLVASHSGLVVSTRDALPYYLHQWANEKSKARKRFDQMQACVSEARAFASMLLDDNNPLLPEVALSISILGSTLDIVQNQKWMDWPVERYSQPANGCWGVPFLVKKWLLEAGWCINDINRLAETQSLPTMIFAASVQRKEAIGSNAHNNCSIDACNARQVDDTHYQTQHVIESGCECGSHLTADDGHLAWTNLQMTRIKEILDAGGVPVVTFPRNSDSVDIQIEIMKSSQTRYVAFSHVWADGLGNQSGNSLPICQLKRLKDMAEAILGPESSHDDRLAERTSVLSIFRPKPKPLAIWVDTLCIPRQKPHKSIAISRMNKTYAEATKVLILDSEIYQFPYEDNPQVLLLKLFAAGWARRVWTMQEGALGVSSLNLQCSSQPIDISSIISKLQKKWWKRDFVTDAIDMDVTVIFEEFRWLRKAYSNSYWRDRLPALAVSLHLLNGRACTNDGDAYLCLSGMIGLSHDITRDIADTPVKDRTMKILEHLRYVPKGIIFSPGEKLQVDGYRWACQSFWKSQPYLDDGKGEVRGSDGLCAEYQGFVLKPLELPRTGGFVFEDVRTKLQFKATYDTTSAPLSEVLREVSYDSATSQLAVICTDREVTRSSLGLTTHPAVLAMVLRKATMKEQIVTRDRDGAAIYTKYLCQITLSAPTVAEVQTAEIEGQLGKAKRPNINALQTFGSGRSEGVVYISQMWYIA